MAVVRGLAVRPNAGADRCHAIEIAWDNGDDYADVLHARVVKDCDQPTAFVWLGSGLCVGHRARLQHQRGWSMN
jgi:hypothetical protein